MKRKNALILAGIWLLVMAGITASTATLMVSGEGKGNRRWVSSEEYAMIERYSRLDEIRKTLISDFYQETEEDTLLTGAIRGMMNSVEDPYTFYYTPEEMAAHDQQSGGAYVGIGLLVQNNAAGYIEVIRVYGGSPAEQAGICVGDFIAAVNGETVSGANAQTLNDAVSIIKGIKGSMVEITVLRGKEKASISVKRDEVSVSNISSDVISGNIGYINIFQFSGDAVESFKKALKAVETAGVKGLVIDLRNNPGGILDDVVQIADELLPEGCIVYMEDRSGKREDFYSDNSQNDLPLVVLVNEMSASASEILAASVQEYDRGTIVGTQTYGKGIVQTLVRYDDDGAGMQYTSACYYTPSGKCIHGIGVTPDVVVESEAGFNNYSGVPDLEKDVQLKAAIELLNADIAKTD